MEMYQDKCWITSVTYICTLCNKKVSSKDIVLHLTLCKKLSKSSNHLFKLADDTHSMIFEILDRNIIKLQIGMNKLVQDKPNRNTETSNKNLFILNQKYKKFLKLKSIQEFSINQLIYLEKTAFFTRFSINHEGKYQKFYDIKKCKHFKGNTNMGNMLKIYYELDSKLNRSYSLKTIASDGEYIAYSTSFNVSVYDIPKKLIIFSKKQKDIQSLGIIEEFKYLIFNSGMNSILVINFELDNIIYKFSLRNQENLLFVITYDKTKIFVNCDFSIAIFNLIKNENKKIVIKSKKFYKNLMVSSRNDFIIHFDNEIFVNYLEESSKNFDFNCEEEIQILILIKDDTKVLFSTYSIIKCLSLLNKNIIFSIKYSKFFLDRTGDYILFKSGIVYDINQCEEKKCYKNSDWFNLMDTNNSKYFYFQHMIKGKTIKNKHKFKITPQGLEVKSIYTSKLAKYPINCFTCFKTSHYFKVLDTKLLITSEHSLSDSFEMKVVNDKNEKKLIRIQCGSSNIAINKNLNYLYLNLIDSIAVFDMLNQEYVEEKYLNFNYLDFKKDFSKSFQITDSKKYIVFSSLEMIITLKFTTREKMGFHNAKVIEFTRDHHDFIFILRQFSMQVFSLTENKTIMIKSIKKIELDSVIMKLIEHHILIITNFRALLFNKNTFIIDNYLEYKFDPLYYVKFSYDYSLIILISNNFALVMNKNLSQQGKIFNIVIMSKNQVAFSSDNQKVIIAGDGVTFFYDSETLNLLGTVSHNFYYNEINEIYNFKNSIFFIILLSNATLTKYPRTRCGETFVSFVFCIVNSETFEICKKIESFEPVRQFNILANRIIFSTPKKIMMFEISKTFSYKLIEINENYKESILSRINSIESLEILEKYYKGKNSSYLMSRGIYMTEDGKKILINKKNSLKCIQKFSNKTISHVLDNNIKEFYVLNEKYIILISYRGNIKVKYFDFENSDIIEVKIIKCYKFKVFCFDTYKVFNMKGTTHLFDPSNRKDEKNIIKMILVYQGSENQYKTLTDCLLKYLFVVYKNKFYIISLSEGEIFYKLKFNKTIKAGAFPKIFISKNSNFVLLKTQAEGVFMINLIDKSVKNRILSFYFDVLSISDEGNLFIKNKNSALFNYDYHNF